MLQALLMAPCLHLFLPVHMNSFFICNKFICCLPYINNTEFARKLQSLARKGDPELMSAFQASFEGIGFNEATFDVKFFLDNAKDIVQDSDKK